MSIMYYRRINYEDVFERRGLEGKTHDELLTEILNSLDKDFIIEKLATVNSQKKRLIVISLAGFSLVNQIFR
jgi:hypothetical protein